MDLECSNEELKELLSDNKVSVILNVNNVDDSTANEYLRNYTEALKEHTEVLKNQGGLVFLNQEEVAKLVRCGDTAVNKLFNRPDFPCQRFGKEKVVEREAFKKYIQKLGKELIR